MRTRRTVPALLLACAAFLAQPAHADVFWKLADKGPSTPDVTTILGDDSRTLAFAASGVFEYRFGAWVKVTLTAPEGEAEVPGDPFFTGGAFFALKASFLVEGAPPTLTLFRLFGDVWRALATFTSSGNAFTYDGSFVYAASGQFNGCTTSGLAACSSESPARLYTISLTDGTRRDGPLLPGCFGRLIAGGGSLYLIGVQPPCIATTARKMLSVTPTPVYRLDGGAWTALPPLTDYLEYWEIFGTSRGVWYVAFTPPGGFRLLNAAGLSSPVAIPPQTMSFYQVSPVEWGSETLYVTDAASGNVYHLSNGAFVPFDPAPPLSEPTGRHVAVYPAGSRLFATGDGWEPRVLSAGAWTETPGIAGTAGGDVYLASPTSAYASRGGTFWKRGEAGWTRLPRPPIGTTPSRGVVWRERPILVDSTSLSARLVAFSDDSKSWEDLGLPPLTSPFPVLNPISLLASGDTLCAAGAQQVACLHSGSAWTVATLSNPDPWPTHLRDLDGNVVVLALGGVYQVTGSSLEQLFTDAPAISDIVSLDGHRFLVVGGSAVASAEPGYPVVLTKREDVAYPADASALAVAGGRLFLGARYPRTLQDGLLRVARGGGPVSYIDPSGCFATTALNDLTARSSLLLPVTRVRKTLPAVVDTFGQGGVHYRSEVTLANLSPNQTAVAHLVPGVSTDAAIDVTLPPLTQRRILDPFPEFVGPVSVDFQGLVDDRDGWVFARVFSPSGGGTAGTALEGIEPGSFPGVATILPLSSSASTRSHIAFANAADGPGLPLRSAAGTLGPGQFGQLNLDSNAGLRQVFWGNVDPGFPPDDILTYTVRNDGTTNDGTVVPTQAPETALSRHTRFLSAVVLLSSDVARYRTEMRLAVRRDYNPTGRIPFHALYRSASVSGEFNFEVDAIVPLDVPDAAAWLAANGIAVDPAHVDGTLTFSSDRPEGAQDLVVTAAVFATPVGLGGDYGVSVPLVSEGRWASTSAIVPGLLENGAFRSNVALANPEPPGGPSTTLTVTLHRASDGSVAGTLSPVTLKPGERFQLNRIARLAGIAGTFDGWAAVARTGGSGRFVAYGVLNDETTSDGTLVSMTRAE